MGVLLGDCGSSMTMVSPPPGVSSADTSPPIASASPRATASPRPDPVARAGRRRAAGRAGRSARGPPRAPRARGRRPGSGCGRRAPLVDTRTRPGGGWWRSAFSTTLAEHPVEQAGVGDDDAGRRVEAPVDPVGLGHRGDRRRRPPRPRSTGRGAATSAPACRRRHVEQVADERVEPVGGVLDGRLELGLVLGREGHLGRAQAADRGLDAGQRGAQVVRHRRRAARCGPSCRGPAPRPRRRPAGARGAGGWRRRARRTPRASRCSVGRHLDADQHQVVLVVGGRVGLRPVGGCRCAGPRESSGGGDGARRPRRRPPPGASGVDRRTTVGALGAEHVDGVLEQHGHLVGGARAGCGSARRAPPTRAGPRPPARPAGHWCAPRTPRPRRRRRRPPGPRRSPARRWSACAPARGRTS